MDQANLKFALVTTFYPPYHFGGDAIYVRNQAHALARRGHSVDVIYTVDPYISLSNKPPKPQLPEPSGVRIHQLRSRYPRLSTLATQQLGRSTFHAKKINEILSENTYDVIHYHNISLVGGPDILRRGSGLKFYTAHEHWLVCPTHILWKNNKEICTSKACIRCGIRYRRPPQLWRYTSYLENCAEHVDEFFALSEFSAMAHENFGFRKNFRIFPTTAPAQPAVPADKTNQSHSDKPYFLFVGRLETIKGLQDVIPLFDGNIDADLVVAGSGAIESDLKQQLGGASTVKFLGNVKPTQLPELYRGAVAVIIPSRCIEVFPLVVLEAFREGTPIIAKNTGPFPEIINKSAGGALYDTNNELLNKLNSILDHPELRQTQGNSALNAFQKYWTESKAYEKYFTTIGKHAKRKGYTDLLHRLSRCDAEGFLEHKRIESSARTNVIQDAIHNG